MGDVSPVTRPAPVAVGEYVRAMRAPFLSASVLPFVFGSLWPDAPLRPARLALGLGMVVFTHLSANLINDVADDRSGVDRADPTYYGLFGGSKLIQAGRLSVRWYRGLAGLLAVLAGACAAALMGLLGRLDALLWFAGILALAWSYSHPPLKLSYRRLGELTVFVLFGPAVVVGGAYIQLGRLPEAGAWVASIPWGAMTASILLAGEVPDAPDDAQAGKRTLVGLVGAGRGWVLFSLATAIGLASLVGMVISGVCSAWALLGLVTILPAGASAWRLASRPGAKHALRQAVGGAIAGHALAGLSLIAGVAT
jgi:1,4-dihydroxy-2-naphthoate octaprenyltransferase